MQVRQCPVYFRLFRRAFSTISRFDGVSSHNGHCSLYSSSNRRILGAVFDAYTPRTSSTVIRTYSTSDKETKDVDRAFINVTTVCFFKYLGIAIRDSDALKRSGIISTNFLVGIKLAFIHVTNLLVQNNRKELKDVMTDSLYKDILNHVEVKSSTVEHIEEMNASNLAICSLTGLKLHVTEENDTIVKYLEVFVRFWYFSESEKKIGKRLDYANFVFVRSILEDEEDMSDWLISSLNYYTLDDRRRRK